MKVLEVLKPNSTNAFSNIFKFTERPRLLLQKEGKVSMHCI